MCGITGFCDFNKEMTLAMLNNANQTLRHRGPDSSHTEIYDLAEAQVGFGHNRLSILDLSDCGRQPMHSDDNTLSVVLNGEIYNFKEIRNILENDGFTFHSDSDTEVILKAWQKWGKDAVYHFIGMFVFVLLDRNTNILYIFRDRAGVKPLYYYYNNGTLLFASELKSLHQYPAFQKKIDDQAVALFFTYGYIPAPYTIFKNTGKLRAGHYLKMDLATKSLQEIKYYDVIDAYNLPKLQISESEAFTETERLLKSAFNYRMVSDVPVGVFLSGGYDSSAVAAILQSSASQKINTFTIGFNEENFSEAPFAKEIAGQLGTKHHEHFCTEKEAQDIIPLLPEIFDEPFGDSSAIPTVLVSRFAREHVTVALSADGGDEIFAGYNRYSQLAQIKSFTGKARAFTGFASIILNKLPIEKLPFNFPSKSRLNRLKGVLSAKTDLEILEALNRHCTPKQLSSLLQTKTPAPGLYDDFDAINPANDYLNTALALDYKTYMTDDILVKVDRATMSAGLEGREPFLDHRLIEFVAQLPSDLKYRHGNKKYLLKKITNQYIPESLLNRPKQGFEVPVYKWLRQDLKDIIYLYIHEEALKVHGYLNVKESISIRDRFMDGEEGLEIRLWLILMFQMWWKRWM